MNGESFIEVFRNWMASVCTTVAVALLFLATVHYTNLVDVPSYIQLKDAIPILS